MPSPVAGRSRDSTHNESAAGDWPTWSLAQRGRSRDRPTERRAGPTSCSAVMSCRLQGPYQRAHSFIRSQEPTRSRTLRSFYGTGGFKTATCPIRESRSFSVSVGGGDPGCGHAHAAPHLHHVHRLYFRWRRSVAAESSQRADGLSLHRGYYLGTERKTAALRQP